MLLGAVLLVAGIALVLWGAERFTTAPWASRGPSPSARSTSALSSRGFEPENLVTGLAANLAGLPHVALGTVIGAAVFMLTAGLGVALLLDPMEVSIPQAGPVGMLVVLVAFALALLSAGTVGRVEGGALLLVALGLMVWLYRRSPVFAPGARLRRRSRLRHAFAPSRSCCSAWPP
jgi:Ca2+/Na+ antiporter